MYVYVYIFIIMDTRAAGNLKSLQGKGMDFFFFGDFAV